MKKERKQNVVTLRMQHQDDDNGMILARITPVHLPSGRVMLYDLIKNVGVAKRVRYTAEYECRVGNGPLHVVNKTIDRGIVLSDGVELKGIDPSVFSALGGVEIEYRKIRR